MLKLETAQAKDRVCGDRAKSGTHQLLLMMRACGYRATQAELVERQACYCKSSTCAPPLLCASGFPRLANAGCLQGFGTTAQTQARQWEPKQGPAMQTGAWSHRCTWMSWLLGQVWSERGLRPGRHAAEEETRGAFQGCCRTWERLLFSLAVSVHRDHKLLSLYPQFIGSTRRGSLNSHLKDVTLRVAPPGLSERNFCWNWSHRRIQTLLWAAARSGTESADVPDNCVPQNIPSSSPWTLELQRPFVLSTIRRPTETQKMQKGIVSPFFFMN